jgi:hypothetical protein
MEVMVLRVVIIIPALLFILSLCARAPVVSQSQDPAQSVDPIRISADLVLVVRPGDRAPARALLARLSSHE